MKLFFLKRHDKLPKNSDQLCFKKQGFSFLIDNTKSIELANIIPICRFNNMVFLFVDFINCSHYYLVIVMTKSL